MNLILTIGIRAVAQLWKIQSLTSVVSKPSSSREKLEDWLQAKREAANMSIEEWDELLKIDEEDDVPNANEEQHKEKDHLI